MVVYEYGVKASRAMQRPSIYLMILGLSGTLYYFFPKLTEVGKETDRNDVSPEAIFDSYSEGINTVFFNEEGEVNYTLRAKRQFHLKDQSALLEEPLVQFFKDGESRWSIVAESGRIGSSITRKASKLDIIELSGDVEVHNLNDFGSATVLSTQLLEIDPNNETLETEDKVQMVTANIIHTGLGMFADLTSDEVYFYSDNSGHYELYENKISFER